MFKKILLLIASCTISTVYAAPVKTKVQDLQFGEALFYYFQDQPFPALVRLMAADQRDQLPHHRNDAHLLEGGMYVSQGQTRRAEEIFTVLLNDSVDSKTRAQAWFYLGKLQYQRGEYANALASFAAAEKELPEELNNERLLLLAQTHMAQGDFATARSVLYRAPLNSSWINYGLYNLGVAELRQDVLGEGQNALAQVGNAEDWSTEFVKGSEQRRRANEEWLALRDRARLALAYSQLQSKQSQSARQTLQQVRLVGPYSNQALLGLGWAAMDENDYTTALNSWATLNTRSHLDAAVQESFLAVPYVLDAMGRKQDSIVAYQLGIDALRRERVRLHLVADEMKQSNWLENLISHDGWRAMNAFVPLSTIPNSEGAHYLYELMAENSFQEEFKNLRDLYFLRDNLARWQESLRAFEDMLATREQGFALKLPVVDARMEQIDLEATESQMNYLKERVNHSVVENDVLGLAPSDFQQAWAELNDIGAQLAPYEQTQASPTIQALLDKQRVLQGFVLWQANAQFPIQLRIVRKSLDELSVATTETRLAVARLRTAQASARQDYTQLAQSIIRGYQQVGRLYSRTEQLIHAQTRDLMLLAFQELERRQHGIDSYLSQVQFAMATFLDRAASENNAE